ncbi:MAG: exodeoxyribonuclease VII large subunit [Caldimicrobium sp.]|nr:exodeoxyribonuclease VII large subunit [Caldimicrobium sp.]
MERTLEYEPKAEKFYYTVKEISQQIKGLLDQRFTYLWLEGEISNLKFSQTGDIFFNLREEEATLRAILFKEHRHEITCECLRDGIKILGFGKLTYFSRSGNIYFIVKKLEPLGIGLLHLKKNYLLEKYKHLFDPNLKREIPPYPQKIALITSLFGAALQDFLKISENRWDVQILIYPVKVQGEGAHIEILQALRDLNDYFPDLDLIVITRGGGSLEDLAPFYTEEIILGIRESKIPVVSAVGHEIDLTLCDLVADKRCSTPSAAAQEILPSKEEILNRISFLKRKLLQLLELSFSRKEKKLKDLHLSLKEKNPFREIHLLEQKLKDFRLLFFQRVSQKLHLKENKLIQLKKSLHALNPLYMIQAKEEKLSHLKMLLFSLSPYSILKRGYSIVKSYPEGRIIKSVDDIREGSMVEIILHEGRLLAKIEKKEK